MVYVDIIQIPRVRELRCITSEMIYFKKKICPTKKQNGNHKYGEGYVEIRGKVISENEKIILQMFSREIC